WIALLLLAALIPSARFAWQNRDTPQFGFLHDDSLYLVSAKSLITGDGYRIESLPEQPYQTKYPPGLPMLLALAWKLGGGYEGTFGWVTLFGWMTIPLLALLSMRLFSDYGLAGWRPVMVGLLLAVNPYFSLFGVNLLAENLFLCLLLGSFLLSLRGRSAAAPVVAGMAYLVRSAGIVLLASHPIALWLRGRRRAAMTYVAILLPVVAAWMVWSRFHMAPPGKDWIITYYTNYFLYQTQNATLDIFPILLWKNVDALLASMGYLVFPKIQNILAAKIAAQVIACLMISGVVRLTFRHEGARDYTLFAIGSALMLLVWHFPPNERFLLPLAPLLFAGMIVEVERFADQVRTGFSHRDRSQRVAAYAIGAVGAVVLLCCLSLQLWVSQSLMPDTAELSRARRSDRRVAYDWIRENTPADAAFVAYDDAVLYLETGRHATSIPLPTRNLYLGNTQRQIEIYRDIQEIAHHHSAAYILFTADDLTRDEAPDQRDVIARGLRDNTRLEQVWSSDRATIFRVR
ncbi:MAG: hypothetical protein ABI823_05610, partial [Bryobacteraceae bacterium]